MQGRNHLRCTNARRAARRHPMRAITLRRLGRSASWWSGNSGSMVTHGEKRAGYWRFFTRTASGLSNTILSWESPECLTNCAAWPTGTREKRTPGRIWPVTASWALWEVKRMYLLQCRKCGREAVAEKPMKCECGGKMEALHKVEPSR